MRVLCTIIIPHYDQWAQLLTCLNALHSQSIDQDLVEIMVIDNGTPHIEDLWRTLPSENKAILLKNAKAKNPYISRNMGIQKANGNLVAFLDAGCRPHKDWLKNGLHHFEQGRKVIAGRFELTYISEEVMDRVHSILYLNNQKNIKRGYGVPAGNLFVSAEIFRKVGCFNDDHVSGNDIEWSLRLINQGQPIYYADDCVCEYTSPSYELLLSKVSKYASGTRYLLLKDKKLRTLVAKAFLSFLPMRLMNFREAMQYRNLGDLGFWTKCKLWFLVWKVKRRYAVGLLRRSSLPET